MKRSLSLLLSIVMILTAFPCISVLAAAEDVLSISFIPVRPKTIYENANGFWYETDGSEYYRYYDPEYETGDILRVTARSRHL